MQVAEQECPPQSARFFFFLPLFTAFPHCELGICTCECYECVMNVPRDVVTEAVSRLLLCNYSLRIRFGFQLLDSCSLRLGKSYITSLV